MSSDRPAESIRGQPGHRTGRHCRTGVFIALAKCKCLNYFLRDWTTAVRDIQLTRCRPRNGCGKMHWTRHAVCKRSGKRPASAIRTGKELTTAAVRRKFRPCLTDSRKPCATITERLQRRSKHLPRVRVAVARNRYRGFVTAMDKAPVKALQAPPLPQLTQGIQPAAQISDSSKSGEGVIL